ncbi:MAG: serine protease [Proteobacteria bacterium]|nr:serine protease [Pseudomonadota bacterium]
MPGPFGPVIPEAQRPTPGDVSFDLDNALAAVLSLRAKVPDDAFTASTLGTEREGHGVLIRGDGLVLTIGYLITEAESVWLVGGDGQARAGHVVGYDQESGFGLVQALDLPDLPVMELGDSGRLRKGDAVILAGHGGRGRAVSARVASRHEFAGYWEYVLDEAIFTVPPHPFWGGAALIGGDGKLLGIGSLLVQQAPPDEAPFEGNMVVPIDLLKPILDDLLNFGRTTKAPRPWLGLYAAEADGDLVIAGLASGGPAELGDVRIGDCVLAVDGQPVADLVDMFRAIWVLGEAGVEVPLTVLRDGDTMEIRVRSVDRSDLLKSPRVH